jgi:hypothetical protein
LPKDRNKLHIFRSSLNVTVTVRAIAGAGGQRGDVGETEDVSSGEDICEYKRDNLRGHVCTGFDRISPISDLDGGCDWDYRVHVRKVGGLGILEESKPGKRTREEIDRKEQGKYKYSEGGGGDVQ